MTVKTTQMQAEGVALVLKYLVANHKPTNIAERLVYGIVYKLYLKIRNKVEALSTPRSGWGIKMTDDEAMALFVFLQNIPLPKEAYQYETIQLESISNQIHQEYELLKIN